MVSDFLKVALEAEIVGQPGAVHAAVRAAVHVMSGLTPRERKWAAFLFMGPSGTGKTQLVQSLARAIHGDGRGLFVADCTHYVHTDPWTALSVQLVPMFSIPRVEYSTAELEAPALSVLLVEYLERGGKEIAKALAACLDTGRVALPGGRIGSLRNCLVFVTTSLCARELLEEVPRIGFQPSPAGDAEEEGRVQRASTAHAEEHFGEDFVSRLDGLIVFHKLEEHHLGEILDRRFARMNRWLAQRGFGCEMSEGARSFLLARGRGDLKTGARELVRVHRRFLEFPLADLLISGRLPQGGLVRADRLDDEEHLAFTVTRDPEPSGNWTGALPREVPVAWGNEPQAPAESAAPPASADASV